MNEEQQERLSRIRERQALNLPVVDRLNSEYAEAVQDIDFLLSLLESDSQAAEPTTVTATAREIVEIVNKTAISLAVCRHGLIREAEDDETVMPDEAEDEIIQDVLDCLTGEETGCLDPEELSAENCAVLMVQDRLNRAATRMRDRCVAKAESYRERIEHEVDEGIREALFGQMVIDLESLTLDDAQQEKQKQ